MVYQSSLYIETFAPNGIESLQEGYLPKREDEEYKRIEDARCKDLKVYEVEDLQIVSLQGLTIDFLEELQIIHDHYEVQDWKNQLETFAEKYNLQYE